MWNNEKASLEKYFVKNLQNKLSTKLISRSFGQKVVYQYILQSFVIQCKIYVKSNDLVLNYKLFSRNSLFWKGNFYFSHIGLRISLMNFDKNFGKSSYFIINKSKCRFISWNKFQKRLKIVEFAAIFYSHHFYGQNSVKSTHLLPNQISNDVWWNIFQ